MMIISECENDLILSGALLFKESYKRIQKNNNDKQVFCGVNRFVDLMLF